MLFCTEEAEAVVDFEDVEAEAQEQELRMRLHLRETYRILCTLRSGARYGSFHAQLCSFVSDYYSFE